MLEFISLLSREEASPASRGFPSSLDFHGTSLEPTETWLTLHSNQDYILKPNAMRQRAILKGPEFCILISSQVRQ